MANTRVLGLVSLTDVVDLLSKDEALVPNWKQFSDHLRILRATIEPFRAQYAVGAIQTPELLRQVLSIWVTNEGDAATIGPLADIIHQKLGNLNLKQQMVSKWNTSAKIVMGIVQIDGNQIPDKVSWPLQETIYLIPLNPLLNSPDIRQLNTLMNGDEYSNVVKQMQETIVPHRGDTAGSFSEYDIIRIDKIVDSVLWWNFIHQKTLIERKEGVDGVNQRMLFHGTKFHETVMVNGFNESHAKYSGMFGAGIYFAENSSKSNQYIYGKKGTGGCIHKSDSCKNCDRKLFLCRVLLGKSKELKKGEKFAHAPPEYNSVTGIPSDGGLKYKEFVVYRGDQAYPEYVITYRIK